MAATGPRAETNVRSKWWSTAFEDPALEREFQRHSAEQSVLLMRAFFLLMAVAYGAGIGVLHAVGFPNTALIIILSTAVSLFGFWAAGRPWFLERFSRNVLVLVSIIFFAASPGNALLVDDYNPVHNFGYLFCSLALLNVLPLPFVAATVLAWALLAHALVAYLLTVPLVTVDVVLLFFYLPTLTVILNVAAYISSLRVPRVFLFTRRLREENIEITYGDAGARLLSSLFRGGAGNKIAAGVLEAAPWFVDPSSVEILDEIGVGGFGVVNKARWKGSLVAVKRLHLHRKYDDAAMRDFLAEIGIVSSLRHPCLILFMGAHVSPENGVWLLTEYLAGGSLDRHIYNDAMVITLAHKVHLAVGVARGMSYLHHNQVVHRDLKPMNVLLDGNGGVKVADFGLSTVEGGRKQEGDAATPVYSSPEVLDGGDHEKPADVYAYGILLSELFTRMAPFADAHPQAIPLLVVQAQQRPSVESLPEYFRDLIESCWMADPDARPAFDHVVQMLEDADLVVQQSTSLSAADESQRVPAPSGRVALVFTDVQASTELWDVSPEAMALALRQHNRMLRRIGRETNGYEVKTEGDAFMMAFGNTTDAAAFCLQVQRALLAEKWPDQILEHPLCKTLEKNGNRIWHGLRVRCGIHFADNVASELDEVTRRVDYFGPDVNRAARTAGLAQGGQICLSDAAWAEIADRQGVLPCPVVKEDIGRVKLRGLAKPEFVRQICSVDLRARLADFATSASEDKAGVRRRLSTRSSASRTMQERFTRIPFDQLTVGPVIGAGSFGTVHTGEYAGDPVAIKKLHRQAVGSTMLVEALHEVSLWSSVGNHPHVLRLVGACMSPPHVCLVMELMDYSLDALIHDRSGAVRKRTLPWSIKLALATHVASAMAFLHSREILHRDLCPRNILVRKDEGALVAKVSDFGFARVKSANQTMTMQVGTTMYGAPEALLGAKYSSEADVFSFAMTLAELLNEAKPIITGRREPSTMVARRIIDGERPDLPSATDARLAEAIVAAWDREPSKRPTFQTLVDVLAPLADDPVVPAAGGMEAQLSTLRLSGALAPVEG